MMIDPEQFIKNFFQSFPRKSVPQGDKVRAWQIVQNHIRANRMKSLEQKTRRVWSGGFLLRNLGKVILTFAVVLVAITLMRGAARANPGETLYTVKKAAEKVEKAFATNDEAKVKVNIKHAKRRLEEVKNLVEEQKSPLIVSATLDALTTVTEEVQDAVLTAGTDSPELVDEALKLATEQEQVLNAVENIISDNGVKEQVQKVIVSAQETANKLKASDEDVKGAAVTGEDISEKATSTVEASVTSPTRSKRPSKEAIIESPIQIDSVIRIDGEEIVEPQGDPAEPKIVPSPN